MNSLLMNKHEIDHYIKNSERVFLFTEGDSS